jgi:mRNA interferase RelE/StbE
MKVEFLAKFSKDLDNIDNTIIRHKILKKIEEFESAKKISDLTNVKKLVGFKSAYRIKIGDYRLGFFFENEIGEFARIIHRKDIYKVFP